MGNPAWDQNVKLDRISDLVVSEEEFNLCHPDSYIVPREPLPRPILENDWLKYPFPSVSLPINYIRMGDIVLVDFGHSGDFAIQCVIKAWSGVMFEVGPNRTAN